MTDHSYQFMMRVNYLSMLHGRIIPDTELHLSFSTASGPGGQNVNKTATKVQLKWWPFPSTIFTDDEKRQLTEQLRRYLTDDGALTLTSSSERSQLQNRQMVIDRLHRLLAQALTPRLKRIPTKPTRSSRERRIATKKQHSDKKASRRFSTED